MTTTTTTTTNEQRMCGSRSIEDDDNKVEFKFKVLVSLSHQQTVDESTIHLRVDDLIESNLTQVE